MSKDHLPQAGGSYIREKSGKLRQLEGTAPAQTRPGAPAPEKPISKPAKKEG